jgi:hypothetical protein
MPDLDEAVEAMVERLGVMYPKWHPTNRRIVAIRLLAALPAGIWHSDGRGTVECVPHGQAKPWWLPPFTPEELDHHRRWLADHGQRPNPDECQVCAALSATDTEGTA